MYTCSFELERLLSTGTLLWSKMNSIIPIAQIAPGNPRQTYPHNPAPKKQLMFNSASSECICTLRDEHKEFRKSISFMYTKNEMAQIAPRIPPLKKAHMIAPNPHSVTAKFFMFVVWLFFLQILFSFCFLFFFSRSSFFFFLIFDPQRRINNGYGCPRRCTQ